MSPKENHSIRTYLKQVISKRWLMCPLSIKANGRKYARYLIFKKYIGHYHSMPVSILIKINDLDTTWCIVKKTLTLKSQSPEVTCTKTKGYTPCWKVEGSVPTSRSSSQAFFATKAAPSITLGFDVFVQLVIAAMTTSPCFIWAGVPWKENSATLFWASFGTAKPCNIMSDQHYKTPQDFPT